MAKTHKLLERVLPALQGAGAARSRAMFGGFGIYLDDVIVGLIARGRLRRHEPNALYSPKGEYEDRLFFRTDDRNRPDYQAAGTAPFTYEGRSGKPIEMPYWEIPAAVLDDPARLCDWALKARAASLGDPRRKQAAKRSGR